MNFEILDISGDVGLKAYGKSCEAAFSNAGLGMYHLITDTESLAERQEQEVEVRGASLEGLLVNYLNELIFYFDTYNFIGRRIEIRNFDFPGRNREGSVRAAIYGEEFDGDMHERRLLVKAATYHNVKVERSDDSWELVVVFDV